MASSMLLMVRFSFSSSVRHIPLWASGCAPICCAVFFMKISRASGIDTSLVRRTIREQKVAGELHPTSTPGLGNPPVHRTVTRIVCLGLENISVLVCDTGSDLYKPHVAISTIVSPSVQSLKSIALMRIWCSWIAIFRRSAEGAPIFLGRSNGRCEQDEGLLRLRWQDGRMEQPVQQCGRWWRFGCMRRDVIFVLVTGINPLGKATVHADVRSVAHVRWLGRVGDKLVLLTIGA